jgi:hypothetical protein
MSRLKLFALVKINMPLFTVWALKQKQGSVALRLWLIPFSDQLATISDHFPESAFLAPLIKTRLDWDLHEVAGLQRPEAKLTLGTNLGCLENFRLHTCKDVKRIWLRIANGH